jgi:hypothetical protein
MMPAHVPRPYFTGLFGPGRGCAELMTGALRHARFPDDAPGEREDESHAVRQTATMDEPP